MKIAIHLIIYSIFFRLRKIKRYDLYNLHLICHMGHILRPHYVLICSNLISVQDINLNPVEFGWNSVDSVLMSNKYIVTLP